MLTMIIQLLIVLAALYFGARYGSLALGAIAGIALALLVFGFGMKPGVPPTDVIYIIVAAVTCAGFLQAAGGMDWLIQLAEKLLRRNPEKITILAPLCTFFLTVLVGTGHVVYTIMPIIADIALKKGVRPERPCAVSAVASQVGITASPIAAAVVAFSAISAQHGFDVSILQVLEVSLPASIIGVLSASLVSLRKGKDLDKDPEYQARLADPAMKEYMFSEMHTTLGKEISKSAKASVYIFLGAIASIVVLAAVGFKAVKMNVVIQIVMLLAAGLMAIFCKASPQKAVGGKVWQNGMVAVVAIYGIAWMSDTFFANYIDGMKETLGAIVAQYPWSIAFVFFIVSVLLSSQGAVVAAMLPLAYTLGIPGPVLLGVLPSVYGYFFIPNYPSVIATVNFDRSGTTRIGKYLLNHSFMVPGLISVGVSTLAGLLISGLIYGF